MNVRAPSCRRRATKDTSQLDCPERRQDGRQRYPRPLTEFAYGVSIQLAADRRALGGCLASCLLASKKRELAAPVGSVFRTTPK